VARTLSSIQRKLDYLANECGCSVHADASWGADAFRFQTLLATDVAVESGSAPAAMESEVKMEEEYLEHAELQKI
jgi:hypothetical protein